MTTIVNLTEVDVNLYAADGKTLLHTFPRAEKPAIAATRDTPIGTLEGYGVPVYNREFLSVEDMPEQDPYITYIVSSVILSHPDLQGSYDLMTPCDFVRDEKGKVIGCKGFYVFSGSAFNGLDTVEEVV